MEDCDGASEVADKVESQRILVLRGSLLLISR